MLLHAFSLWQRHHYETAHVVAWTVTEFCINNIWDNYLDECAETQAVADDRTFINSARREKLNGRDFSASTITEFLSLSGKIDFGIYKKLNRVRQNRNRWLHKMTPVACTDSCASLNLAIEILRVSSLLDVKFYIPCCSRTLLPINIDRCLSRLSDAVCTSTATEVNKGSGAELAKWAAFNLSYSARYAPDPFSVAGL